MPHLILEHSANLDEQTNFTALFKQCHRYLAEHLPTDIQSCKSRALAYSDYFVGDGQVKTAFVHLTLKIMAGRTADTLDRVGKQLLVYLQNYFAPAGQQQQLALSLEIVELSAAYFKD